jgi:hypothetical protein
MGDIQEKEAKPLEKSGKGSSTISSTWATTLMTFLYLTERFTPLLSSALSRRSWQNASWIAR